jgi:hypothetical protein
LKALRLIGIEVKKNETASAFSKVKEMFLPIQETSLLKGLSAKKQRCEYRF